MLTKRRLAEVSLRQDSINRLAAGKSVTVRLEDIDLEIRFDPLARVGGGSIEDLVAEQLHLKGRARG